MKSRPVLIGAASHWHIIILEIAIFTQIKILADYSDVPRIIFGLAIGSSYDRNSDGLVCLKQV